MMMVRVVLVAFFTRLVAVNWSDGEITEREGGVVRRK